MRIATWNVERLKHKTNLKEIQKICEELHADVLVLTETDTRLQPGFQHCVCTPLLAEVQPDYYRPTENRVTVFTNYEIVATHPTYDARTAICAELETERGSLLVYGTIMGIYGNRHPNFRDDIVKQADDFKRLSALGKPLFVVGDYNLSFSDNYYYTGFGRNTILESFMENQITIVTAEQPECIDHIAVSTSFLQGTSPNVLEWNQEKTLSDHKGISVTI